MLPDRRKVPSHVEHSITQAESAVMFKTATMDYGVITIPKDTPVQRVKKGGTVSDWFVKFPHLLPNNGKSRGALFIQDATTSGVIVPASAVK